MPPEARIPPQLKLGPFTIAEARAAGISATALRGKSWRRLDRGIYYWSQLTLDPWRFLGVWQRAYPSTLYAGFTAAWLHGMDVDPYPIDVIANPESGARSRPGRIVRRCSVPASDVVRVRGVRATSLGRTLSDLCARIGGIEGLVLLDAALRLKLCDRAALNIACPALAPLAEPAESPMETRLRMLLIKSGLPRPEVQRNLLDSAGRFVGRADLYYPHARLVIEFDGHNHRDRLIEDNRRQNRLLDAGYALLRFTSADLSDPKMLTTLVRRQLSAAAAASSRPPAAGRR